MNLLHYAIFVVVVLIFVAKLSYHLFYEIPRDRKLIAAHDSQRASDADHVAIDDHDTLIPDTSAH